MLMACTKEDENMNLTLNGFTDARLTKKIISSADGYWIVTSTPEPTSCAYCSSINYIDGVGYYSDDKFYGKDKLGTILDAETDNNTLLAVTPSEIINFSQTIEQTILKTAASDEVYQLMDKDTNGKCWILSNKSIFNLSGDKIALPYSISCVDFEVSKDKSFWLSASDTVYHITESKVVKFTMNDITGKQSRTAIPNNIYNLRIDFNNNVWINTSDKLFKFKDCVWNEIEAGKFVGGNFKTIPFMDMDNDGKLWLAERNYQAFTDLHCFDGSIWTSHKLDPSLETWINDIETVGSGYMWLATSTGLLKLPLN